MKFYTSILGLVLFVGLIDAYKTGPPVKDHPEICNTMKPNHPDSIGGDVCPFEIVTNTKCYKPGQKIQVVLKNKDDRLSEYIEGLFVQMRKTDEETAFGMWTSDDNVLQQLECNNNANTAMGHKEEKKARFRSMYWTAPQNTNTDIKVWFTVVFHENQYWTKQSSALIPYKSDCAGAALIVNNFDESDLEDSGSHEDDSAENDAAALCLGLVLTFVTCLLTIVL